MKQVTLNNSTIMYVDDEDYFLVHLYSWICNPDGYAQAKKSVNKKRIVLRFHRLVMKCPDNMIVDHIDGNKLNNCKNNLRICTYVENNQNKSKGLNTSSKYKGVSWSSVKNKWKAQIKIGATNKHIGDYSLEITAARMYNVYAKLYFGAFAKLNQLDS